MENNNEIIEKSPEQESPFLLSPLSRMYLRETSKWARFLAILGFIAIGLILIVGVLAGAAFSMLGSGSSLRGLSGFGLGFIYICIGIIYFFPLYYLINFSNHILKALNQKDSNSFDTAFHNLKRHYKFIGILTIICLSIYLIFGVIVSFVGGLM